MEEQEEDLGKRLDLVKSVGFNEIIASYQTKGMEPAKFDETYFKALDRLVLALKKRNMRFWLEDYAPFPTGNANGAYQMEEYRDLNKRFVDERHIDIEGPAREVVLRTDHYYMPCTVKLSINSMLSHLTIEISWQLLHVSYWMPMHHRFRSFLT